ncbi:hypothetical protein DFA_02274 [Cavenderia fasciculata]|uniref:Uncharacterized protein n=1 Tax=Cavenderia fasciculata TaxID=261658 RepID=F4PZ02_CACFS|nr:uncharacterized protein DFA_02274 [Cavenderia fasciculata]EGG19031.1 hypothetical protein DFA_02274 [Cavenderia fasciculata]|eukprot:XP_004366664.1 hypothetical protein DFA_02274 [Cavenderia fasciculata]
MEDHKREKEISFTLIVQAECLPDDPAKKQLQIENGSASQK